MGDKIIQIISVPDNRFSFNAITYDDNGNRKEIPVIGLALTAGGEIQFIYIDSDGYPKRAKKAHGNRW